MDHNNSVYKGRMHVSETVFILFNKLFLISDGSIFKVDELDPWVTSPLFLFSDIKWYC